MMTEPQKKPAVTELQELLEENPELLKELDADLIRLCEDLEVL